MKIGKMIKRFFEPTRYSMRIFIDNFGFGNKGDQLMLESVLKQINDYLPDAQVLLRKSSFLKNPSYCIEHKIYPLQTYKLRKWEKVFAPILRIYGWLLNKLLMDEWFVVPSEVDVVLDCRGFHIGDTWYPEESLYLEEKEFYELFSNKRLKVIYLPQAFGSFEYEWSKKMAHLAYGRAQKIYARDARSYGYMHDLFGDDPKIEQVPDFTCILHPETSPCVQLPRGKYVLVIPNCNMIGMTSEKVGGSYIHFLSDIITYMQKRGENVYMLNHEADRDENICYQVNELLIEKVPILTNLSGPDIKSIITCSKLVISARFHGVVSSLTTHTPTLCTSWSHKYKELLKEHECENSMIDVTDTEAAISKIEDALLNPNKYTSKPGCEECIEKSVKKMWNDVVEIIKN